MATPYGFPGQYDGLGQHQTYGYPPSPMYNDGPSWGAGPDELAGGPLGYGRGNYAPSGAPHHGFNALERYSLAEQQLLLMQAQRMQGLGAGFPDAMHLRRGSPRPMRPLPGFSDYDIPGAGYYPMESPLKLEVVDTLHVSTPHDRSLDRADLCDVFFPMPQMKKLSFHENYVFVLFDSVAAARNAMLQLQQGQAGPKAAQLTVTFARQSYRDNYYHPDEVYMPSKRLHLTHFPKNTHARELERIFARYRGFERLEHNIKWAYVDFVHENYAKEAMEDLNSHTNLIVSYAKPGAGEMKMQQRLNNEMLWAMQYAARQRNVGYPVDEFKRLSPRGVQGLEEFRSSPGSVTELSQILQTMQLADAVKRQNAPAAFDIGSSMRSGTNSTSPTLLPTESRRLSAPLLPGSEFDEGSEYLLGPMEPRQSGSSERSSSPFSLSGIGPSTSPVKHGVIRRPAATEGDAREAWASVSVTTPTLSSPMTPTSSEPQSPQTSSPAAQDKGFSASSTETLVFAGADSPYSSPTLSSVSDELKDRKRGDKTTGDGQWSFFKHSINVRRSLGVSDSEDDIDSDKTTTETA